MSLTLITGRAGSGKTEAIYKGIAAAAKDGRRAVLLAPTYPDVVRARRELAVRGAALIRVDRIDDYVAEMWRLLGDGRVLVGPHQRRALLRQASEQVSFGRIAKSASLPGFVSAMEPVVARLGEYAREDLDPQNEVDADLVRLLDGYDDLLADADLIDRGAAARLLSTVPPLDDALFVDGVSDLSPRQQGVFSAWAQLGVEVAIALPWEDGFPATAGLDSLIEELAAGGEHVVLGPRHVDGELGRLEASLFGEAAAAAGEGRVVFCQAAGLEAEAALVADRVASLISGDVGARPFLPGSIAVVFRDAAKRVDPLRAAFRARRIPSDFDVQVSLTTTPFGRAFAQLVSFFSGQGRREELLGLARAPFFGIGHEDLDGIEATWRRDRVYDRRRLVADVTHGRPLAADLLGRTSRLVGCAVSPDSLLGWKKVLDSMLAEAFDAEAIERTEAGASAARVHGAILTALAELAALDPPAPADALGAVLRDMKVPADSRAQPGRVLVTEAHRLRSRRYEALIVGGLTSEEFSSTGRPSIGLEAAQRLTGLELPTDHELERLLFYSVVTRASEHLEFVRLTADSEGRAIRPSIFWEQVLDLYRPSNPDAADEGSLAPLISLPITDLDRVAPMITGDRREVRRRARSGGGGPRPVRPRLEDSEILAGLADRGEFSATELEIYVGCPFRWFYERVIRPDQLDSEIDVRVGGTLIHEALRRFYEGLPSSLGTSRVTPGLVVEAIELFERQFPSVVEDSGIEISTLSDADLVAGARERGIVLVNSDAAFLPGYAPGSMLEYTLGGPGGSVDLGGFRLKGRVDRVDEGPGGLVVQDYKWSRGEGHKQFGPKRLLQLPLYAAAIASSTRRPVVGAVYRTLNDGAALGYWRDDVLDGAGMRPRDNVDEGAARALVDAALETAREAVGGIRAGRIEPDRTFMKACEYCAAAAFCPKEG